MYLRDCEDKRIIEDGKGKNYVGLKNGVYENNTEHTGRVKDTLSGCPFICELGFR
jgi:hypothetical protein